MLAEVHTSVPEALTVLIAIACGWSEVAVLAARNTDGRRGSRSDGTEAVGVALLHVHDGGASSVTDTLDRSPLAILVVVTSVGGACTVGAAGLAASFVVAESAHGLDEALSGGVGVVDVDVDVGAGSGAGHDVGVPHAARIGDATVLSRVHDGAVTDTTEGGSVPSAERRADAIRGVVDGEAADTADCGLGVPFTFSVGVTLIR